MSALLLAVLLSGVPADEARAVVAPFKKNLKDTLFKALEVSPEAAIEVCAVRAPELARAASTPSVTVGRSAFKLRNQANAARPWLTPLMNELAKEKSGSEVSRTVVLPDGTVGYAEPIWMAAPCLVCHGKNLSPAIDAKLKTAYPKDAARGFELGEFRGVFWAEVKPLPR